MHMRKPEKSADAPALTAEAPPQKEPEEIIVQPPSEEDGRPVARGAAYQPEAISTPAAPVSNEETKV